MQEDYEPQQKSSVWPWVLTGCGVLIGLAVLVMIVFAIATPRLMVSRVVSREVNAVGSCRAYASAQALYKRNDWESGQGGPGKIGVLEYARPFPWLHKQKDGNGDPINLIDKAFADAAGSSGIPKHGYVFQDLTTIAGSKIDWVDDYGLCGIPAVYGRTGHRTFIVSTSGTVFGKNQGSDGSFVQDYPADPTVSGWIIAQ